MQKQNCPSKNFHIRIHFQSKVVNQWYMAVGVILSYVELFLLLSTSSIVHCSFCGPRGPCSSAIPRCDICRKKKGNECAGIVRAHIDVFVRFYLRFKVKYNDTEARVGENKSRDHRQSVSWAVLPKTKVVIGLLSGSVFFVCARWSCPVRFRPVTRSEAARWKYKKHNHGIVTHVASTVQYVALSHL